MYDTQEKQNKPQANKSAAGSARTPTDVYPQFRTPASRLATYVGWPAEVGLCPQDLAAAGFFHSGRADWLQCFSCGGGIFGWQKGEQPLEVHLRYYPLCPFARAAAAPDGSRPAPLLPSGVGGGGGGQGALAIQTEDAELLAQHPLAKVSTPGLACRKGGRRGRGSM